MGSDHSTATRHTANAISTRPGGRDGVSTGKSTTGFAYALGESVRSSVYCLDFPFVKQRNKIDKMVISLSDI